MLMTKLAVNDLHEISEYIAKELREPKTARKLVGKIKETVMELSEMPERYAFVADQYLSPGEFVSHRLAVTSCFVLLTKRS